MPHLPIRGYCAARRRHTAGVSAGLVPGGPVLQNPAARWPARAMRGCCPGCLPTDIQVVALAPRLRTRSPVTAIISVRNLVKTYPSGQQALKGIDLEIQQGEIFALLGPNGAGKTTLISIICGIVNASSGRV